MRSAIITALLLTGCATSVDTDTVNGDLADSDWNALMDAPIEVTYAAAHEPDGTRRANVRVGEGSLVLEPIDTEMANLTLDLPGLADYPRNLAAYRAGDHIEFEGLTGTLVTSVSQDPCGDSWSETSRIRVDEGTGSLEQFVITFSVETEIQLIESKGCSGIEAGESSSEVVLTINLDQ